LRGRKKRKVISKKFGVGLEILEFEIVEKIWGFEMVEKMLGFEPAEKNLGFGIVEKCWALTWAFFGLL
jgi:hypothetical protein